MASAIHPERPAPRTLLVPALTAAMLLLALLVVNAGREPQSAAGGGGHAASGPGPLPVVTRVLGRECDEWATAWWRWALSVPAVNNPLLDPTGAAAAAGQAEKVWFLAGMSGGGGTVVRDVTVPPGTPIFFPVHAEIRADTPRSGGTDWTPEYEADRRASVAARVDAVTGLSLAIDGRPVPDLAAHRFRTPAGGAFLVDLPADNLLGVAPGVYGPAVADGIYVLLPPLASGPHTIRFTSELGGVVQDVTYRVTVRRQ